MDLFLLEIINGDMAVKNYYIRLFERAYYLTLNWHTQKSQSFTEISQNNTRKNETKRLGRKGIQKLTRDSLRRLVNIQIAPT